jgi:hypothetical protein
MRLLDNPPGELARKLQNYLGSDAQFRIICDYVKRRFDEATYLTAHNWEHIYRDMLNAIVIGEAENADMHIVMPATAMHDIGFLYGATGKTHGAVGADKLPEFLQSGGLNYAPEAVIRLADCIRTHKGSMLNEKPGSLEARVVADADLLEKFGPFGVYSGGLRTYTEFNWPLAVILKRGEELSALTLETPTGQRLAEPGRQFVANFYRELREAAQAYT